MGGGEAGEERMGKEWGGAVEMAQENGGRDLIYRTCGSDGRRKRGRGEEEDNAGVVRRIEEEAEKDEPKNNGMTEENKGAERGNVEKGT